jgi:hypothetical protein
LAEAISAETSMTQFDIDPIALPATLAEGGPQ